MPIPLLLALLLAFALTAEGRGDVDATSGALAGGDVGAGPLLAPVVLVQAEDDESEDLELAQTERDLSNWLAWLVGLPLLAVIIVLVLLLTRGRKRNDPDEEDR